MRIDGTCSDWAIDAPLQTDRLSIEVPRSVRLRGLEREPEKKEVKKLQSFFFTPITTSLQRNLVGNDIDAYGAIDVASYVNIHTRHLELEHCDFDAMRDQLEQACIKRGDVLKIKFDFGPLGTDDTLGMFVRLPIEAMAKKAGFGRVRATSNYHGEALFPKPDLSKGVDQDERNLGDKVCDVFPVRTPLSKFLLGDFKYLIKPRGETSAGPNELLGQDTIDSIKKSIADLKINKDAVLISLKLGPKGIDPRKQEVVQARQQGSKVQLDAVNELRDLGFGDIKFLMQIENHTYNTFYRN